MDCLQTVFLEYKFDVGQFKKMLSLVVNEWTADS